MKVEVKPHRARDIISKAELDTGIYAVHVDGHLAGFVGHQPGARIMLHKRFSPMELFDIERMVKAQLEKTQTVEGIVQAADPVIPEKRDETFDDFD
ncbi:MAG: hypothetical protein GY764_10010 [Halieaceae bacterium]|nr:hypothetical protein [Halieaceae bacterium]